jgi:hypothetical protein
MSRVLARPAMIVALVAGALALPGAAQAHLAAVKLGPPPTSCLNAPPSVEWECLYYGQQPNYLGYTYIGGLRISPKVIHEGATAGESFYPIVVKCISAQPCASSWGWSPPGEEVSGCGLGGVSTDTSCTFKATFGSAYPPSELTTGWSGGWEVGGLGICGFNGCATAYDYYYIVPGNLRGLSGTVTNAAGQPSRRASSSPGSSRTARAWRCRAPKP